MVTHQTAYLLGLLISYLFIPPTPLAAQSKEDALPGTAIARPWTRWWWMGNAVDSANLRSQLTQYAEAGLGGVEITPIYGARGYEQQYIAYLSPAWMNLLHYTLHVADSLGLGVDLNLGTGWPFGGPQITPQYAAATLILQTYDLRAGDPLPQIVPEDSAQRALNASLVSLTAYPDQGEAILLTDRVAADGALTWTPPAGSWKLYALFAGKTRQQVKRAAPGGAGYTLDHLSREALPVYLRRFEQAFGMQPPAVRSYFNDSYEVYNADFSPQLPEVFQQQHSYDLRPHVRTLLSEQDSDMARRIKADYRATMSEMLLHHFTRPWSEWIHQHNAHSRNQAHGSPGNLLDLYAAVDIPECETFGATRFPIPGLNYYTHDTRNVEPDPIMMQFATSASHLLGKPLTSSETFTWLGEHFKVTLAQMKPEVEQAFLAGVNHVFFHGTSYSPAAAPWPGWLFYASTNFGPSNSWWPHLTGLNEYITRCQSVLQAGRADRDVLMYWPMHDVWHHAPLMPLDMPLAIHSIEEWLYPTPFYRLADTLTDRGYLVDFVSDGWLDSLQVHERYLRTTEGAANYRVIVVPSTDKMPVATLKRLLALADAGGTLIFQKLPTDVPGWHRLAERRQQLDRLKASLMWEQQGNHLQRASVGRGEIWQAPQVQRALDRIEVRRERLVETGLRFIRRRVAHDTYYYLANHTDHPIDSLVPLATDAPFIVISDPQDGRQGLATVTTSDSSLLVRIALAPGEAWILKSASEAPANVAVWPYLIPAKQGGIPLNRPWQLHFTQGGPTLPEDQSLNQLASWTALPDTNAVRFSGTAEYRTSFFLEEKAADDYLLQLGEVRESARVWVNEQPVGIAWSVPFQLRIGSYVKPGNNTLRIEVANLMANRIRDLDRRGVLWRNYHEINFVNLEYEPFDASGWEPQPSGLLGPVKVVPMIESRSRK